MDDVNLLIIQPVLTSYRRFFFNALLTKLNKVDVYANLNSGDGFLTDVNGLFKKIHTPVIGNRYKIYYQKGIILSIFKNKPTAIFMTADFRAMNYWILLALSKLMGIPIFSHGQGLYNKPNSGALQRLMFNIATSLSSCYVCYTNSVYKSLIDIGVSPSKLSVMDNTIVNNFLVKPDEKKEITHRVFYVGRLREGCNLELLFNAMVSLQKKGKGIALDIVGDGSQRRQLEILAHQLGLEINFLGAIYDDEEISVLSKKCTLGIYPGDAGLSLVHYMSLSLVPIVHDDLTKHMGPEPSYIKSGINGLTFKRNNVHSLAYVIENVLDNKSLVKKLSKSAFNTYYSLSEPSMASKLISIMKPFLNTKG